MTQKWRVPPASDSWALFLDVDGTLLDIAPAPDTVSVTPGLPALLARLADRLSGALALVSGRALADVDGLFRPYRFPAAGIHGVERRGADGRVHVTGLAPEALDAARERLGRFAAQHPGLLLEDKGRSLALHYRNAPHLEAEARAAVEEALAAVRGPARLQRGHCVFEIRSAAADKGTAIARFMQEKPFAGRVPVFVGDDVTDQDGFAYVESAGGHALFVGPQPQPGRGWLPRPADVREWLAGLLR